MENTCCCPIPGSSRVTLGTLVNYTLVAMAMAKRHGVVYYVSVNPAINQSGDI